MPSMCLLTFTPESFADHKVEFFFVYILGNFLHMKLNLVYL